jgi:branched-chain amino acid transport system ATP-binding protein
MLLEVRDLVKDFGGLRAVNGFSFTINEREILGLIGPNGSGKTTCINIIAGYHKPTGGKIIYNGKEIQGKKPWEIAQMGILRTYQRTKLFPSLTALENVLYASHMQGRSNTIDAVFRPRKITEERQSIQAMAMEALEFVGLQGHFHEFAGIMSAGHQRALSVAMAVVSKPRLLLLDEPASGLSLEEGRKLIALMQRLKDNGASVLLVDHDMRIIMTVCDRIVVVDHGSKIAEGRPEEVRANEDVVRAYMGAG